MHTRRRHHANLTVGNKIENGDKNYSTEPINKTKHAGNVTLL